MESFVKKEHASWMHVTTKVAIPKAYFQEVLDQMNEEVMGATWAQTSTRTVLPGTLQRRYREIVPQVFNLLSHWGSNNTTEGENYAA